MQHIYNSATCNNAQKWLYENQKYSQPYQLDAFILSSNPLLLHLCGETAQHLPSSSAHSHALHLVRQDLGELLPKIIERTFGCCWHLNSIFRLQECWCNHTSYHCVLMCESTLMYTITSNLSLLPSLLKYEYYQFSTVINHIDRENVEPVVCILHTYSCVN